MLKLDISSPQRDHGRATVVVHGDLDQASAPQLYTRLNSLLDAGVHELVVDLSAVPHDDPRTMRNLTRLRARVWAHGGRLTLLPSDPQHSMMPSANPTQVDETEDLTAHCEQAGSPGYRPETADQP